ncbi:2-dehydropantoate 2-reductase [Virgibacillus senegalensis]|uniref:2-dehydropantoate 2-reductase n=1 Tax=Virgibacillus senegalensis TaxID=1499679 RepID=UPI00069E24BD|nr:2-dehydropantoate 2-reductase [Virgibacillus senegalensis]
MNVGIIGGGAVGLLTAARLTAGEHEVTVYVRRKEQKDRINNNGVFLVPDKKAFPVKVLLVDEMKKEDIILVAVKQYQLAEILPSLHAFPKVPLIFMQNGMGHLAQLNKMNESHTIFIAVVEFGAMKHDDNTVEQTGIGVCKIAPLAIGDTSSNEIERRLASSSFPICIEDDWYRMLTEKLVVNAVINPLTALFQVKNGSLLENEHLLWLARKLCQEACEVLGLSLEQSWERVKRIAFQTKDNHSSMRKDIETGRKTEIEAITGYILEIALCEPVYTAFVYRSIKALEWNAGGLRND